MNEIDQRNLAALAGKPDRDLRDFIAGVLPDTADADAMWDLLLAPELAERSVLLLTELAIDVEQQFAVSRATGERNGEWVAKATKFKFLVAMRLGRARLALKQQNLTAVKQVQAWQAAAHQLAAAVLRHEGEIQDGEPEDRALWGHLDTVRRPDGATVREWMALHQPKTAA